MITIIHHYERMVFEIEMDAIGKAFKSRISLYHILCFFQTVLFPTVGKVTCPCATTQDGHHHFDPDTHERMQNSGVERICYMGWKIKD